MRKQPVKGSVPCWLRGTSLPVGWLADRVGWLAFLAIALHWTRKKTLRQGHSGIHVILFILEARMVLRMAFFLCQQEGISDSAPQPAQCWGPQGEPPLHQWSQNDHSWTTTWTSFIPLEDHKNRNEHNHSMETWYYATHSNQVQSNHIVIPSGGDFTPTHLRSNLNLQIYYTNCWFAFLLIQI